MFAIFALLSTASADPVDPEATPASEAAPSAPAPDLDRARELYDNGKTLFDEANYRAAITAWEASWAIAQRPALLFNIANAYERLSDHDGAIRTLNEYRAFAAPEERDAIERRVRNLEILRDELKARMAAPTPAPVPTAPEPSVAIAPPPPEVDAPSRRGPGRGIGASLVGVGVVGLGVGAGLGVASMAAGKRAEGACTEGGLCLDSSRGDVDSQRALATGADIAFLAGAVAVVAGSVTLFATRRARVEVGPSSVAFGGTF